MLDKLTQLTGSVSALLWGNPLTLAILLGTGVYLTVRLRAIQVRGFRSGVRLLGRGLGGEGDEGEVSLFQALSTVLSATVGTGNIAGVATAITLGGPGALFWMWVTAVVGMATKFTECALALRYREIRPGGEAAGGPMFTLANGLGMRRTGMAFAAAAMVASFGIGNMVQANSVVEGLVFAWPEAGGLRWLIGIGMAAAVAAVILGGVRRIAAVASMLVPVMAGVYLLAAVAVLAGHAEFIPAALGRIFELALNPAAAGAAALGEAIRWGVARGLFSNEAGLGSSPMAFAATRTSQPANAGLVAMLGPFVDTLVICTLTGLVIVTTQLARPDMPGDLTSTALTAFAFGSVLGHAGTLIVGLGLALFAYSTMIAWSYYGDRCALFLFGGGAVVPYRIVFTLLVVVGATVPLQLVWNIADIMNLLMAIPNLLALVLLAGVARQLAADVLGGRGAS